LSPLGRTAHDDQNSDFPGDDTEFIIEPQSGDLYKTDAPSGPLQRFPFSMAELVDMSPYSMADVDSRRDFVGRKETSLLLVDIRTGKIKATLNSEQCPWVPYDGDVPDDGVIDLDELEDSGSRVKQPATEVFIGRTGKSVSRLGVVMFTLRPFIDYYITIYTKSSNGQVPVVQNLSYSRYGPNKQDTILQMSYKRTQDDTYIQSMPNGDIISFKATDRDQPTSRPDPQPLWGQNFSSPT
jgi:serine/threonine-protein kinase/endoribonuclease IRE1